MISNSFNIKTLNSNFSFIVPDVLTAGPGPPGCRQTMTTAEENASCRTSTPKSHNTIKPPPHRIRRRTIATMANSPQPHLPRKPARPTTLPNSRMSISIITRTTGDTSSTPPTPPTDSTPIAAAMVPTEPSQPEVSFHLKAFRRHHRRLQQTTDSCLHLPYHPVSATNTPPLKAWLITPLSIINISRVRPHPPRRCHTLARRDFTRRPSACSRRVRPRLHPRLPRWATSRHSRPTPPPTRTSSSNSSNATPSGVPHRPSDCSLPPHQFCRPRKDFWPCHQFTPRCPSDSPVATKTRGISMIRRSTRGIITLMPKWDPSNSSRGTRLMAPCQVPMRSSWADVIRAARKPQLAKNTWTEPVRRRRRTSIPPDCKSFRRLVLPRKGWLAALIDTEISWDHTNTDKVDKTTGLSVVKDMGMVTRVMIPGSPVER